MRVPFLAFLRAIDSCRVLLIAEFSQVTLVQQVQGLSRSSSETFSDTVSVAVHSEDTLLVRGGKLSHVLWDACSRAHPGSMGLPMGRLGQDKPAFGWELEPFWPLLLYRAVSLRM